MSTALTYSTTELQDLGDWFSTESEALFQAKARHIDEESRVRLHVAAQDARRIAADLRGFATAHQALQNEGLLDDSI
ncbi:MAG: hypothetical protein Q8K78_05560 [Planctomycetaceae bacterium]|nr:hypothetical protein [Planctomycetaceae bacterium]